MPLIKSEHHEFTNSFPLYQQTLKFFNGKFVLMTVKGLQQCQHLTWQQSIYDFQKTHRASSALLLEESELEDEEDLTQVFLRALELYKGRIKGY